MEGKGPWGQGAKAARGRPGGQREPGLLGGESEARGQFGQRGPGLPGSPGRAKGPGARGPRAGPGRPRVASRRPGRPRVARGQGPQEQQGSQQKTMLEASLPI